MPSIVGQLMDQLRRDATSAELRSLSDRVLLFRFVRQRDHDAFTAMVRRHGPMVYTVCYRLLGNAHEAEDAFQASFLVLSCKARSLHCHNSLAAWLHGVAVRIALNARRASLRRPIRHEPLTTDEAFDTNLDPHSHLIKQELFQAVEEEVQRLPNAYRLPVILCSLEGLSQEEAAERLGWGKPRCR